ncbi:MAG TPA: hypothetical protein PLP14_10290, partial [Chitinophagaceae bacterium]|nr:hypothetical protein [Chitinophagaceae bacterium]
MKLLWFPFQILFFLYSASVLVVLILLGYPLALLFCLFPEPGRDRAMYHLLRVICFTWFLFSGIIPVTYHRRKQSFNRRTIFIMNHQSFIDAANLY